MIVKEGDLVYACINKVPVQCRITAIDFGGNGNHLVYTMTDRQAYIVSADELADNAEDCYTNYMERVEKEYNLYHGAVDTTDSLILHLLSAAVSGRKIDGIEKSAIIDRASQFTQIDVNQYLEEIAKAEKEARKKHEIQECY